MRDFLPCRRVLSFLRHYSSIHKEFIPEVVPAVIGNREVFGEEDDKPKTSPRKSGVQLNLGDLLVDVEYALDVQKRNKVIAQANLELVRMKDENNKFVHEGRELPQNKSLKKFDFGKCFINNKEASWLHAELFFVLVSMWLPQQHLVSIWTPHGIHVETMWCPVETT